MTNPAQNQPPEAATKVAFKIEVAAPSGGGLRPEMSPERFLNATQETLKGIAEIIEESCASFVDRLNTMPAKPKECAIEFGVNAGGEAGVPFVAKGTLGANFKVSLKWTWS
jgi:hypothetical protein